MHRPHLRQVRRHGEVRGGRDSGSREPSAGVARGRGQGAGSRGRGAEETSNRRRHRCHALPRRRTLTIHHAQPLAAPASPGAPPEGEGGVGIGWGGVAGQQDQAGWFAQHPEAPQRLAGADAFSDRRRARAAARQQVRVSRGGCGGRQPLAAAERRRQILVKWQKMFLEKIVVFRAFGGRLGLCWWAQAWGPPPSPPRPSLGTGMASGGVRGGPPHAAGRVLWTPGPPLALMPGRASQASDALLLAVEELQRFEQPDDPILVRPGHATHLSRLATT